MKKDRFISLNAAIEAIHNYWIAEMDKLPRKMAGEYEVLDGDYKTPLRHNKKICEAIEALPSAQPNLSEAYSKAVFTWLMDYQIRAAELKGRYTPYEVLSWVINDWRKENG